MTWKERLDKAKECGKFTDDDKLCVSQWSCCAVGEHKEEIEMYKRYSDSKHCRPVDDTLNVFGMEFCHCVTADNIGYAIEIYKSIQSRVQELQIRTGVVA